MMKEDKRSAAVMLDSDVTEVQLAEGLPVSSTKKPRMDQEEIKDMEERGKTDDEGTNSIESKRLHDQKLSAWVWGTGGAEKYQGEGRKDAWALHGESAIANFILRRDLLKQVGLDLKQEDNGATDHLLQYHLWPGPTSIDMYPQPILGSEREARLLNELRMFKPSRMRKTPRHA